MKIRRYVLISYDDYSGECEICDTFDTHTAAHKAMLKNYKDNLSELKSQNETIKFAVDTKNAVSILTDYKEYYWQIKPLTIELTDDEIKSFNV